MRILVIGGCGFTGSVLVNDLLAEGHKVTVFDSEWFGNHLSTSEHLMSVRGDVRDIDGIPFEGQEVVIHLANIANDPSVDLNPTLSWEVNVLSSMRIAEAAIKAGVKKLVYASSGSVYGVKVEDRVTEDLELVPISVYNKTKMIAERVFLSYSHALEVYVVRPATVCGISPRMRLDLSVNLLTYQALKNGEITVFGGDQVRPNIHINDLSRVYQHLIFENVTPGVYNAGFENLKIADLASRIQAEIDSKVSISESNDPRSYRQDSSKLLATGFLPKFSVRNAIKDLKNAFESGVLTDDPRWHTVPTMRKLGLG
jgi:nucleoside-diphosphate-sugar epimerase